MEISRIGTVVALIQSLSTTVTPVCQPEHNLRANCRRVGKKELEVRSEALYCHNSISGAVKQLHVYVCGFT